MDPLIGQIVLAALIVFVPIVGFSYLISARDKQKHKFTWRKLAAANNLNFNTQTDHFPSINGKYRGYYLDLTIDEKINEDNQPIPYTRIVVTRPQNPPPQSVTDQPLTLGDLMKPFVSTETSLKGKVYAIPGGRQVYYEQFGIEADYKYLQCLFDLLVTLTGSYPKILTFESQAVSFLQKNAKASIIRDNKGLRPIMLQLLDELIPATNTQGYHGSNRLCPFCLTRSEPSKEYAITAADRVTEYRCRNCGQKEEFIDWAGPVEVVLDNQITTDLLEKQGILQINWLPRQAVFDFDRVSIIQATDEEVERFAVLVGNDTDENRQPKYKTMPCTISSSCHLSENTLRILRHTFGPVEIT
jgi:hypothetical protein